MLADDKALGLLGHDESGDTFCTLAAVGYSHDDVVVRDAGVGDPRLATVEYPAAVLRFDSGGLNARSVGAGARLGQAEREYLAL